MARLIVKSVPLDFAWPINKPWEGYVNPYIEFVDCDQCEGSGFNAATNEIADTFWAWHDQITQDEVQALVDAGRLLEFTHTFSQADRWKRREDGHIPTAEEVNASQGERGNIGHDAINRHILTKIRAKRLGIFRVCPCCRGEGILPRNEESQKLYSEWGEYEPPKGDGYQFWECDGEIAYPVSPVCDKISKLIEWHNENIKS